MLHYTQITELISELMFSHDCVIVPRFGGFVARHYNSGFNKGNNLLFPQTKQILFNKQLIHNDGLLISSWMQKSNLNLQDATKQIEDYKDYIQSLLSVKKRFELKNLGLLYIDSENSLRFEAKSDVNFLLESFGFEPVVANALSIPPVSEPKSTKHFEDRKITVEQAPAPKRSYAKIATLAIGLPLTLAFLMFAASSKHMQPLLQSSANPFYSPEKSYVPNHQRHEKSFFIEEPRKPELLVDAKGFATFKLFENGKVLVASINDSVLPADKTHVARSYFSSSNKKNAFNAKYQVVVGCFGVEENAHKLVKELHSKKIQAGISGVNQKGLHVVSCGGFDSKDDAAQLLASVKSEFPNAWVMAK